MYVFPDYVRRVRASNQQGALYVLRFGRSGSSQTMLWQDRDASSQLLLGCGVTAQVSKRAEWNGAVGLVLTHVTNESIEYTTAVVSSCHLWEPEFALKSQLDDETLQGYRNNPNKSSL